MGLVAQRGNNRPTLPHFAGSRVLRFGNVEIFQTVSKVAFSEVRRARRGLQALMWDLSSSTARWATSSSIAVCSDIESPVRAHCDAAASDARIAAVYCSRLAIGKWVNYCAYHSKVPC